MRYRSGWLDGQRVGLAQRDPEPNAAQLGGNELVGWRLDFDLQPILGRRDRREDPHQN